MPDDRRPSTQPARLAGVTQLLLAAVAAASLVGWFHRGLVLPLSDINQVAWGDFGTFYMAGYCGLHGHDPYDLKHTRALARTLGMRRGPPRFCYPPHLAALFIPVAATLSPREAAVISIITNTLLYWASVFLLLRGLSFARSTTVVSVAVLVASWFSPSWDTIRTGQVNIVVLLCIACGLMAYTRGRWTLSGACLGMAMVIKLFPGLVAAQLIAGRKTKAVAAMTLVGLAVLGVSTAVLGLVPFERYLRRELPQNAGMIHAGAYDVSLKSFVNRVSGVADRFEDSSPAAQRAARLSRFLRGAVVIVSLLLMVVPRRDSIASSLHRVCLLLVTAMIVNAWTWTEHLVVALPGIAVAARWMSDLPVSARRLGGAGLLVASILLALGYHTPAVRHGSTLVRELLMSSSLNLYGLGLLWVVLAAGVLLPRGIEHSDVPGAVTSISPAEAGRAPRGAR